MFEKITFYDYEAENREWISKVKAAGFSITKPDYLNEIFDDVTNKAACNNCFVVMPQANQAQIDIDSKEAYQEFWCRFNRFTDYLGLPQPIQEPSKSGKDHWHVTMTFPRDLSDLERLAIQSIFGSDSMREMLNLMRYLTKGVTDSCFFEPKQTVPPAPEKPFEPKQKMPPAPRKTI